MAIDLLTGFETISVLIADGNVMNVFVGQDYWYPMENFAD